MIIPQCNPIGAVGCQRNRSSDLAQNVLQSFSIPNDAPDEI